MVVAAVLAFTVNLLVLRSRDDTVPVVAVALPVAAGEVMKAGHFKLTEVGVSPEVLARLYRWEEVTSLSGRVAARALGPGDLLGPGALVEAAAPQGMRSMSIPLDPARALGGDLVAGDRIDLIRVDEAGASYILANTAVLAVADPERGGLGVSGDFHVVVAVTRDQALEVAAAVDAGSLHVIRSTGAAP
jgi:Flp pilus assembly protein CpaB